MQRRVSHERPTQALDMYVHDDVLSDCTYLRIPRIQYLLRTVRSPLEVIHSMQREGNVFSYLLGVTLDA